MLRTLVCVSLAGLAFGVGCSATTLLSFEWNGSSLQTFSYPGVDPHQVPTVADSINDKDQIVGTYGYATTGFIKTGSSYSTFSVGFSTSVQPSQINNEGVVVGSYYGYPIGSPGPPSIYGFIWNGRQAVTVEAPTIHGSVSETSLTGINDHGQIVGYYTVATAPETSYGFLLNGSTFTQINAPGSSDATGSATLPFGIDNNGNVLGLYTTAGGGIDSFRKNGSSYATMVPAGKVTTGGLTYAGAPPDFSVYDLNTSRYLDQSALNAALQQGPYNYLINGFNDSQYAVGQAEIITPYVPEPRSLALVGIAALLALAFRAFTPRKPSETRLFPPKSSFSALKRA